MLNFQYALQFPTRGKGYNTQTLAAGGSVFFSGVNARQERVMFFISNLHPSLVLKLKVDGMTFATIWNRVSLGFNVTDEIEVYNPNDNPVDFEVGEFFINPGFDSERSGRATRFGPQSKAARRANAAR